MSAIFHCRCFIACGRTRAETAFVYLGPSSGTAIDGSSMGVGTYVCACVVRIIAEFTTVVIDDAKVLGRGIFVIVVIDKHKRWGDVGTADQRDGFERRQDG